VSGRVYIREGSLIKLCRKILKKRWVVLFSDALMYGRKDESSAKVKFHRLINLNASSTVRDLPDKTNSKNGFQVITSLKSFLVYADTPEEKKSWMESFQAVVNELINNGMFFFCSVRFPTTSFFLAKFALMKK
jgi:hypothetical protein